MARSLNPLVPEPSSAPAQPLSSVARFTGKNVLITGAGSGFGRRTAERFAAEGVANLYLVDRRPERLQEVAGVIRELGANPVPICVDLGVTKDCESAIDQALAVDPRLDVLISNAAAWVQRPFIEMTHDDWRRVMSVNLDAYFTLSQRAAQAMKNTGGGVILFTSSISALGHGRNFTAYCVGKAAIVSLAKAIAVELAPWKIRANCVSPGPADTQQSVDIAGEDLMNKWRAEGFPVVPMNRLAATDDIASAFLYLASDDARYVSGINLVVDGAYTAQVYDLPKS